LYELLFARVVQMRWICSSCKKVRRRKPRSIAANCGGKGDSAKAESVTVDILGEVVCAGVWLPLLPRVKGIEKHKSRWEEYETIREQEIYER
jgi:hypothetical protein